VRWWVSVCDSTRGRVQFPSVLLPLEAGWSRDPLEAMIAEGKADTFAVRLFPRLRPPHTDPLDAAEKLRVWEAFQKQLAAPTDTFREDFMSGIAEGMPRWAGYRLGFEMVNTYLEAHPDLRVPAGRCCRRASSSMPTRGR